MTRRRGRVVAWIAALATSIAAPSTQADPPSPTDAPELAGPGPIDEYDLANGLHVVLEEDHRTPRVAVHVAYRVGGGDDPPGHQGLAHLFEHLMFDGSRHVPRGGFSGLLDAAGATGMNAVTRADSTDYVEDVPSNRLALALWLESDRMAFLLDRLDGPTLDGERRTVLRELDERVEGVAAGRLPRFVDEAMYPEGHPYRSLPEYREDIEHTTLPEVQWFFQRWYSPANATLVLVGDFATADARSLVERYFGPVARGPAPGVAARPAPLEPVRERHIDVYAPIRADVVEIVWPTPAYMQPGDAELDVVSALLARGGRGRLVRALVEQRHLAVDVTTVQSSHERGSLFMLRAACAPDHDADELLRAIDAELDAFRAQPPARADVATAVRTYTMGLAFAHEGIDSRASRFADYVRLLGAADGFARDAARYERVDPSAAQHAARTYLARSRRLVALVHANRVAAPAGDLGRADVPTTTTTALAPSERAP